MKTILAVGVSFFTAIIILGFSSYPVSAASSSSSRQSSSEKPASKMEKGIIKQPQTIKNITRETIFGEPPPTSATVKPPQSSPLPSLCREGYVFYPLSGRCEKPCPPGQGMPDYSYECAPCYLDRVVFENRCVCKLGKFEDADGLCVDQCPEPQVADKKGRCVCPGKGYARGSKSPSGVPKCGQCSDVLERPNDLLQCKCASGRLVWSSAYDDPLLGDKLVCLDICPPGQAPSTTNVCMPCPSGQGITDNQRCLPCKKNEGLDADGKCVDCGGQDKDVATGRCKCANPDDKLLPNGVDCAVSCPNFQFMSVDKKMCLNRCPFGQDSDAFRQCRCAQEGPTPYLSVAQDACLSACPPGQEPLWNNRCICNGYGKPSGKVLSLDLKSCVDSCPEGQRIDPDHTMCECNPESSLVPSPDGNSCTRCPTGEVAKDEKCVCPPEKPMRAGTGCEPCDPYKPYFVDNHCSKCPASGQLINRNGDCFCPDIQTVVNGRCQCPMDTMWSIRQQRCIPLTYENCIASLTLKECQDYCEARHSPQECRARGGIKYDPEHQTCPCYFCDGCNWNERDCSNGYNPCEGLRRR